MSEHPSDESFRQWWMGSTNTLRVHVQDARAIWRAGWDAHVAQVQRAADETLRDAVSLHEARVWQHGSGME